MAEQFSKIIDLFKDRLVRLHNRVDYPLREFFRFRRRGLRPAAKSAPGLRLQKAFMGDPSVALSADQKNAAREEEERLRKGYRLEEFSRQTSPINYSENLFYLQLLERALDLSGFNLEDRIEAADIGPSHWFYIQALYALLRWWKTTLGRIVTITGYEVDAYRVYKDFHSRHDHALAHMRNLPDVTYVPRGFWRQPGQFHLITVLFPFVFERDHLEWGLPDSLFKPEQLLADAWDSLKPGGLLVVVNQGVDEHRAQGEMLEKLGIHPSVEFQQDPLLYAYPLDRYVWGAIRES